MLNQADINTLVTVSMVAKMLSCSRSYVHDLIARGKFDFLWLAKNTKNPSKLLYKSQVEDYIKAKERRIKQNDM